MSLSLLGQCHLLSLFQGHVCLCVHRHTEDIMQWKFKSSMLPACFPDLGTKGFHDPHWVRSLVLVYEGLHLSKDYSRVSEP